MEENTKYDTGKDVITCSHLNVSRNDLLGYLSQKELNDKEMTNQDFYI